MAPEISDHDSATACLGWVRELAAQLDLDHPDPAYQAGKADQLARAATDLAHDLRVIAKAAGCAATWSTATAAPSWPTASRTPTCGPATTTPACPPAPPTPTTTRRNPADGC